MNPKILLRNVIIGFLNEGIAKTAPGLSRESLDDQIDALLISYEKNSIGADEFELDVNEAASDDDEKTKFDLNRFSNKLARFVQNYESLLDIETVILFRAIAFIEENHGTPTAEELKTRLSEIHGLHVSKELVPADPVAPNAVGAEGSPSMGGGVA